MVVTKTVPDLVRLVPLFAIFKKLGWINNINPLFYPVWQTLELALYLIFQTYAGFVGV